MPCNGIAVATVKCAVPEATNLLTYPENLGAVTRLLQKKGYSAAVLNKTLLVNNVAISIQRTTISAALPENVIQDIRQTLEKVAGIIQKNVTATGQTYANGYLVLQVNL